MNLKQQLIQTIETRGYVPLNELHQIASDLGHKQSTAERILRKIAEENKIQADRNGKKFIRGYRYVNEPQQLNLI